jgi:serine protease
VPVRFTVWEFYNSSLRHYFITGSEIEATDIDQGAAGPGWSRTGQTFYAYPLNSELAGLSPVCRFYGTPGVGPNSHFYTASAEECAAVKTDPGWFYEGIAFRIAAAPGGTCASGSIPVYRVYNGRWRENDSGHRYLTDLALYAQMQAQGWNGEGVVFCAPA